jgi:hypothetical protein
MKPGVEALQVIPPEVALAALSLNPTGTKRTR